jgi:hypothetical protein
MIYFIKGQAFDCSFDVGVDCVFVPGIVLKMIIVIICSWVYRRYKLCVSFMIVMIVPYKPSGKTFITGECYAVRVVLLVLVPVAGVVVAG